MPSSSYTPSPTLTPTPKQSLTAYGERHHVAIGGAEGVAGGAGVVAGGGTADHLKDKVFLRHDDARLLVLEHLLALGGGSKGER